MFLFKIRIKSGANKRNGKYPKGMCTKDESERVGRLSNGNPKNVSDFS